MTSTPPMGSTMPLSAPTPKAFQRLLPAARNGIEMMAPSGTFWMAIPKERARAPAVVMPAPPFSAPAMATPTAIPSGKLWMVTARASIVVLDSLLFGPSGPPTGCRCGVIWSISNRKAKPPSRPMVAGQTPPISIPGISRDHTEAATITPDAKPSSIFCTSSGIAFFIKKTKPAPSVVPRKGIKRANRVLFIS